MGENSAVLAQWSEAHPDRNIGVGPRSTLVARCSSPGESPGSARLGTSRSHGFVGPVHYPDLDTEMITADDVKTITDSRDVRLNRVIGTLEADLKALLPNVVTAMVHGVIAALPAAHTEGLDPEVISAAVAKDLAARLAA